MTATLKLALAPTLALAAIFAGWPAAAGTMPDVTIAGLAGAAHDGFYIADGELSAFGGLASTAVAGMATNRQWRQAPTFANPAPQLARPVTPTIVIGDNEGYLLLLNGQPYVSGTPITELGVYMLTVEAFGVADLDRVLVGAHFEIIPEPTTGVMLLLLTGATLVRRQRGKAQRPATRGPA